MTNAEAITLLAERRAPIRVVMLLEAIAREPGVEIAARAIEPEWCACDLALPLPLAGAIDDLQRAGFRRWREAEHGWRGASGGSCWQWTDAPDATKIHAGQLVCVGPTGGVVPYVQGRNQGQIVGVARSNADPASGLVAVELKHWGSMHAPEPSVPVVQSGRVFLKAE